jgi:hypothetical protein
MWVPQDKESINMLQAFNDPILGDMWACAHHSFLRDLFLSTPYIYAHHVAAEAALAAAAAANVSADADDPAHAEAPLHAPAADGDA